jgi:3-hydroxyisobutyrate dehydrogenase-like beta-hydroxyacid dehydrogenase
MEARVLGFVGVGRMGALMASRLLDAGHALFVCDTNPHSVQPLIDRGAKGASSPEELASVADLVLMSLPTPAIVQTVAMGDRGLLQGSRARTLIDLSTTGPSAAAQVAKAAAARRVSWVDAPVSGGPGGARAGTLAVMVSCPQPTFQQVDPVLATFGKTFYVGDKPGLAQVAKLANNLLSVTALAVSSEAIAMGVKAGLDAKVLIDIINAGSGRNSATQDKFPRAILPGTFDYGFSTGLSYKDLRLCVDEAETLGVPMIVGAAVRQLFAVTQAKFGPDSDFTSVAKVIEEWAGVQMRARETA